MDMSLLSFFFIENYELSWLRNPLLDSLVVECWFRVREVPGSIPSQGPRHTKDAVVAGMKKRMTTQNRLKSNAKKLKKIFKCLQK